MNTTKDILAENIQNLRRKKDMTQDELACAVGVSFQAVSKWETGKSCPDVTLLPDIADALNCTVDALFSRECETEAMPRDFRWTSEFPWPDDNTLRGIVCLGRKILSVKNEPLGEFTFHLRSDIGVKRVESPCTIVLEGNAEGCSAGHSISVSGNVNGSCMAGHSIVAQQIQGTCNAVQSITVEGDILGPVKAQRVSVGGRIVLDADKETEL